MSQTLLTTIATASNFPSLLPELRNTIYEYAACCSATSIYDCGRINTPNSAMARVSRQIRSGYLPILQRSSIFVDRSTRLLLRTSAFQINALRGFLHDELSVFPRVQAPELVITLLVPRPSSLVSDPSTANMLELWAWLHACNDSQLPASRTYRAVFDWSVWDRPSARHFADEMFATHFRAGYADWDRVRLYTALLAAVDGAEMSSARVSGSVGPVMRR